MENENSALDKKEYKGSWAQVPEILERINPPVFPDREFNIKAHGAVSGGRTDTRDIIIKTISSCSESGGGLVVIPPGTYLVNGPIHLEDNVNLHLQEGAKILFGVNPEDYLPEVLVRWEGVRLYSYSPLVYAYGKKNIALTGTGVLDGQAEKLWTSWFEPALETRKIVRDRISADNPPLNGRVFKEGSFIRPDMVQFYECENILVEDIKLMNSPMWCMHPVFSRNITIRRMKFDSTAGHNNDGIDPDSCEDVYIHDVEFNNGDDCIAIKSGRDKEGREVGIPSKNIVIRNCVFNSYTGLALGSEASGSIYNVFAEDCKADSRLKRGVYLKTGRKRGGEYAHVRIRNMNFLETSREMLNISTRFGGAESGPPAIPYVHDVRMENIKAAGPCTIGIVVEGQPEQSVTDVIFKDVEIDSAEDEKRIEHADRIYMQNVTVNGELIEPGGRALPPDVYAGEDRVVELSRGNRIKVKGRVEFDGRPVDEDIEYLWAVVKGDVEKVKISGPHAIETPVDFAEKGTFVLELSVICKGLTGSHFLTATVR